ncbi:MAG: capsule biosynthesis protein CapA [Spirochaetae bacterium HGW-Spirochaetae-5]|nr:MAG: capsule biosynthesis protein CapA [Spirochaetae bacterium HGW-Spirochaetae-5]
MADVISADTPGGEDSRVAVDKPVEVVPVVESLDLLFIGDIMGHDSQIRSALQPDGAAYDYTSCFDYIRNEISAADVAIANLEVTLAGPPYKGYPRFSSPDALAAACKEAGIDVMVTANNHCVDRGKEGLERTIKTLDNLNILHTGTFLSDADKKSKSPLIIEKNNFKIAIISYTMSTNEIPVPKGSSVNLYKRDKLMADIALAKKTRADAVILYMHWGAEYMREPGAEQVALAEVSFNAGVNIIIGSHPHVIQKSILSRQPGSMRFVSYSLGNFIANQKAPNTNGGKMIKLTLSKKDGVTSVSEAGYILTWIYGPVLNNKKKFYVLPCKDFENRPEFFQTPEHYKKMKYYIEESRRLLDSQNKNVDEI